MLLYDGRQRDDMAKLPKLEALEPRRLGIRMALSLEPDQPRQCLQDLVLAQADRLAM